MVGCCAPGFGPLPPLQLWLLPTLSSSCFTCCNAEPPARRNRPPAVLPLPGATLGSFLIALLHFAMELMLFKTLGLATALQPMIVAGALALPSP